MKTDTRVLIYDNDCLLCKTYTGAFVKTGLLPASGRQHFNSVDPEIFKLVDQQKCNNEIPLVDIQEHKVWYGIDAMLEILGAKFPFIKRWGNLQPIKWVLKRLYNLISYNRKVIVATPPPVGYDCSPEFHLFYRFIFFGFLIGFHWIMLTNTFEQIFQQMESTSLQLPPFQISYAFVLIVSAFLPLLMEIKKGIEAMGQIMMTISIFFLCLVPLLIVNTLFSHLHNAFVFVYIGAVFTFICREANRRLRYWNAIKNTV